jgi:hypothetical protein
VKQSRLERKRLVVSAAVFALALGLRVTGDSAPPPFDELYHLKRIEISAQHFPRTLAFDEERGERGAFCPWPPLYDLSAALIDRIAGGTTYLPPLFFALLAAWITVLFGPIAGLTTALSPYLIGISRTARIDHHFVEPALVLWILCSAGDRRRRASSSQLAKDAAAGRRRCKESPALAPLNLALALTTALFIQPALLVAAGLAFIAVFFFQSNARPAAVAFALTGVTVLIWRLTLPSGYPDSAWFLGYPHVALLAAAAVACALRERTSKPVALLAGITTALLFPGALLSGMGFFAGDPWLRSILEFQPMFRDPERIGTDIANLTGGAVLVFTIWRRDRTLALFAIGYLLLALTSRRFLVPAIPLLAIAGAVGAANAPSRLKQIAYAAATLGPPLLYTMLVPRTTPSWDEYRDVARAIRPLPRGRVLAPWSFGHAIDVIGGKPVVIDNFGSMPDEIVFNNANDALLTTHPETLIAYCRSRSISYVVLPDPERHLPGVAAAAGLDRNSYASTALARRTVWWRLYRTRNRGGAPQIWRCDELPRTHLSSR